MLCLCSVTFLIQFRFYIFDYARRHIPKKSNMYHTAMIRAGENPRRKPFVRPDQYIIYIEKLSN